MVPAAALPAATPSVRAPTLPSVIDADDEGDDGGAGLPLPPDDRVWRHPSELHGNHVAFWRMLSRPWRVGDPAVASADDEGGPA